MERTGLVNTLFILFSSLTASGTEKNSESYWEDNLVDFVNRLYPIIYSDKFKYSDLDPTAVSFGDNELTETRKKLITCALKNGKVSNKK